MVVWASSGCRLRSLVVADASDPDAPNSLCAGLVSVVACLESSLRSSFGFADCLGGVAQMAGLLDVPSICALAGVPLRVSMGRRTRLCRRPPHLRIRDTPRVSYSCFGHRRRSFLLRSMASSLS